MLAQPAINTHPEPVSRVFGTHGKNIVAVKHESNHITCNAKPTARLTTHVAEDIKSSELASDSVPPNLRGQSTALEAFTSDSFSAALTKPAVVKSENNHAPASTFDELGPTSNTVQLNQVCASLTFVAPNLRNNINIDPVVPQEQHLSAWQHNAVNSLHDDRRILRPTEGFVLSLHPWNVPTPMSKMPAPASMHMLKDATSSSERTTVKLEQTAIAPNLIVFSLQKQAVLEMLDNPKFSTSIKLAEDTMERNTFPTNKKSSTSSAPSSIAFSTLR